MLTGVEDRLIVRDGTNKGGKRETNKREIRKRER